MIAGYGWSETARASQTIEDRSEELHSLLAAAGILRPYILVAHSYGAFIVRAFARRHPAEVAALVLVDTAEESSHFQADVLSLYTKARLLNRVAGFAAKFGLLHLLKHWIPLDRFGFWLKRPSEYAALCDELASMERVPCPCGIHNRRAASERCRSQLSRMAWPFLDLSRF